MAGDEFLTFRDFAERMQSKNARVYAIVPYWNRRELEGTSVGFYHFCEWFEVNVHNAASLRLEVTLALLQASPSTKLDQFHKDKKNVVRWFGGAWVGEHHVRVWYNPQAL